MSLRDRRDPTTDAEHQLAVFAAESRLGRKLSEGEKRTDIVAVDRDLKNGKQQLVDAIKTEQRRAAQAWVAGGTLQLKITPAMEQALKDLYDAGVEHATHELKAAGVDLGE